MESVSSSFLLLPWPEILIVAPARKLPFASCTGNRIQTFSTGVPSADTTLPVQRTAKPNSATRARRVNSGCNADEFRQTFHFWSKPCNRTLERNGNEPGMGRGIFHRWIEDVFEGRVARSNIRTNPPDPSAQPCGNSSKTSFAGPASAIAIGKNNTIPFKRRKSLFWMLIPQRNAKRVRSE